MAIKFSNDFFRSHGRGHGAEGDAMDSLLF